MTELDKSIDNKDKPVTAAERCAVRTRIMLDLRLSPQARILFFLIDDSSWQNGSMRWHWRKIAMAIGVGHARFFDLIKELTEAGVVTVKRDGRQVYYEPISLRKTGMNREDSFQKTGMKQPVSFQKTGMNDRRIIITETDSKYTDITAERLSVLEEALAQYGTADAAAIQSLDARCRALCPDVTAEEIVQFIHYKGKILSRSGGIVNPIGFLISTVPQCLTSEAFTSHRRENQSFLRSTPHSQSVENCGICGNLGYTLVSTAIRGTGQVERKPCRCQSRNMRRSA